MRGTRGQVELVLGGLLVAAVILGTQAAQLGSLARLTPRRQHDVSQCELCNHPNSRVPSALTPGVGFVGPDDPVEDE
jgi:hypothetical protein